MADATPNISKLHLTASFKKNVTILSDVFFTAPFKVAKPFKHDDGSLEVIVMSASPGIMEGDEQDIEITVSDNARLSVTSQSYEKIHKMETGNAKRMCNIKIGDNAFLKYVPLPTIPFENSAFETHMHVDLCSESSRFIFSDIISCGRSAREERFKYKFFKSKTHIRTKEKLVYVDNTHFSPNGTDLTDFGFYEGNTHLLNVLIFNFKLNESRLSDIRAVIEAHALDGGASFTASGDVCVKVLGDNAQKLLSASNEIIGLFAQFY